MKDRIMQIMRQEHMNQKQFADALAVAPASLSNIFSGRTAPTMRHAEAVHRAFPKISPNWLLFGEGDMYGTMGNGGENSIGKGGHDGDAGDGASVSTSVYSSASGSEASGVGANGSTGIASAGPMFDFASSSDSVIASEQETTLVHANGGQTTGVKFSNQTGAVKEVIKYVEKPQRTIVEIRIFYSDGTFETFAGSQK